ncbi:hypothetical protein GCM10017673_57510 [Streptosporangium violaceochromogenes]|nr:hypothetical protein GCM10017673_57510 [Streptosporangium violaceochromogenes]
MTCICEAYALDPGLGPCETHDPEAFTAWLSKQAPRVAAAREAGDPLWELYPLPARGADVPQFAALRAALSAPAREWLDNEWGLITGGGGPWPHAHELLLAARDSWRDMVPVVERNVLRELLASATGEDYPVHDSGELNFYAPKVGTPSDLLEEADTLADIARRALALERMLRDHANDRTSTAADYLLTSPGETA